MPKDWRDSRSFRKWAEGRSQLEIHRAGWNHAGPWFTCTDPQCPGLVEAHRDDHCFSVIEGESDESGMFTIHLCTYVDVRAKTLTVLCISTVNPDGSLDHTPPGD